MGAGSGLLISLLEKLNWFRLNGLVTRAIDMIMNGFLLEENSSFKMLGLTFFSKLDLGTSIISIAKSAYKKIGALIRSMKFLSPEVALFLYRSTIRSCMEYCSCVWAGALSFCL